MKAMAGFVVMTPIKNLKKISRLPENMAKMKVKLTVQ